MSTSDRFRGLADEQGRRLTLGTDAPSVELGMPAETVEAGIDTLIGNVFAHTAPGTDFALRTGITGSRPWLEATDEGPGFPDVSIPARGMSGGGSTGLGLDIVRRMAELTGGDLEVGNRPGGGAVVRVWFGQETPNLRFGCTARVRESLQMEILVMWGFRPYPEARISATVDTTEGNRHAP